MRRETRLWRWGLSLWVVAVWLDVLSHAGLRLKWHGFRQMVGATQTRTK